MSVRLEALREAGRALRRRSFEDTLAVLCDVLDAWSDPSSRWRRELEAALPEATGFSPATVREGLARALGPWNGAALRALVKSELGGPAEGFDATAVLLAGSIPMPTLSSLLAPLVLRSPVFAKCASRDPVTAPLVARSLAEADPELGRCLHVAAFPGSDAASMGALLEADCVVATGSDETVAAVAERLPAPLHRSRRLLRHGHRLSLAVLGEEARAGDPLDRAAEGLALDVALWDQLGCLSPIAVYVVGDAVAADQVATALAEALAEAERRWPRGRVEPADAARLAHERAEAEMREAAGRGVRLLADAETRWTVVREADARPRPAPLHRFVRIHPVADADALLRAIVPLEAHLAGVAVAGFGTRHEEVSDALLCRGASRVCEPGTLQAPPLGWRRDGHGVLTSLIRGNPS